MRGILGNLSNDYTMFLGSSRLLLTPKSNPQISIKKITLVSLEFSLPSNLHWKQLELQEEGQVLKFQNKFLYNH